MKQFPWKTYVLSILLPEAVGGLSGWLTREGAKLYGSTIAQPPLSPPGAAFPIVWAALFALMGISAARVYLAPPSSVRSRSLRLYLIQLAFNFCWSLLFFNLRRFGLAFFRTRPSETGGANPTRPGEAHRRARRCRLHLL